MGFDVFKACVFGWDIQVLHILVSNQNDSHIFKLDGIIDRNMPKIGLVSSDLNGTLVRQHTMSDMIKVYLGDKRYLPAKKVFDRQTSGTATMEEAFQTAGPLTKGLKLRDAIKYTIIHIKYVNGFPEFVNTLKTNGIPLVINSTGYSVTIYAIREQIGTDKIHGHIGNYLRFGLNADPKQTLSEAELECKTFCPVFDWEFSHAVA